MRTYCTCYGDSEIISHKILLFLSDPIRNYGNVLTEIFL
jgi:hypothetical protein